MRALPLFRKQHGGIVAEVGSLAVALYDPLAVGRAFATYMAGKTLRPQSRADLNELRLRLEQSGFGKVPHRTLVEALDLVDGCGLFNAFGTERDISDLLGSAS